MSGLRTIFFTFLAVISFEGLLAQHPSWQNFTTSDGLPSNEIYGMMQDSRGFLWFATSLGICRFNGYEFHRPVDTSITAVGSAFKIAEDFKGRIWFNHLDATMSIIENDTVRPWMYNGILDKYRSKFASFGSFSFEKDGTLWLPLLNLGFLVVRPDGAERIIPDTDRDVFIFTEVEGKMIFTNQSKADGTQLRFQERSNKSPEILLWKDGKGITLGRQPVDAKVQKQGKLFEARRLKNGNILVCYLQTYYLLHNQRLIWHGQKDIWLNQIFIDTDGSILLACGGGENKGLLRFRSIEDFQLNIYDNLLPGQTVSAVLRDHEGGWWVSTVDAGIYYCKNPSLNILDVFNGLPSNQVGRLATDGAETVYIGLRTPEICAMNRISGRISHLPSLLPTNNSEINLLRFDTVTGRLWCGPNLSFLEKNHWANVKHLEGKKIINNIISIKKINPEHAGKTWWASSTYGFFIIDPRVGTAKKVAQDSLLSGKRTFSVTKDLEGNLWVTVPEGLRLWNHDNYELPPFTHPALRYPARNVELLPLSVGGGLVIALRGAGLLIRNKNGQFTHLTVKDGLASDMLMDLDISPDGIIYASSNLGLNILSPQPNGTWHIETINTKHGLPSNQVNDVALIGGETWVATDKGIARFKAKPAPAPMPIPILEKFVVNNKPSVFFNNLQLPHDQNNLSLRFFALHFRSGGDIPYRYRLLGADTAFIYTHTREVNFAHLPSAHYTFEVQAQNEDGQWSESAHWPFAILPPWWATWSVSRNCSGGFSRSNLPALSKPPPIHSPGSRRTRKNKRPRNSRFTRPNEPALHF